MSRHHPGWPHVGLWEGRWAMVKYLVKRHRWPRQYVRSVGMHLTLDQRFRGLPRPENYTIHNPSAVYRYSPGTRFTHRTAGPWLLNADGLLEPEDGSEMFTAGALIEQHRYLWVKREA